MEALLELPTIFTLFFHKNSSNTQELGELIGDFSKYK